LFAALQQFPKKQKGPDPKMELVIFLLEGTKLDFPEREGVSPIFI